MLKEGRNFIFVSVNIYQSGGIVLFVLFKKVKKPLTIILIMTLILVVFSLSALATDKFYLKYPVPDHYYIVDKFSDKHYGVDILGKLKLPVVASAGGVINELKIGFFEDCWTPYPKKPPLPPYAIKHENGYYSIYQNLGELYVKPGDKVEAGQIIGTLGAIEGLEESFLHFSVSTTDPEKPNFIDPESLFEKR